ncbi:MAG: ketoacyl-ACP synthase III [Rhodospirillales bacterium]|nr:ketoacyl-ACP synthase III [Alphaproteobacteria bacterium]MBL6928339.1 ketoacyl-ACP synthase III [Rhodospirillales bacterium]
MMTQIIGTGSYLPERVVTNDDLAKTVDTTDEWIRDRTGIRQRHIAAEGELTSDLAFNAANRALEAAGMVPQEIDMIIVGTTTPDHTFPATSARVQAMLNTGNGFAFDLQAVCSGFIYGLSVADNFIRMGQINTALVIGAETMSRLIDWQDRNTCVLFGDGAGAVVLRGEEVAEGEKRGVLSTHLHSNGHLYDLLHASGGPSWTQTAGHIRMQGKDVFRHAVTNLASVVDEALEANGLGYDDIDWLVPHQANQRILDGTARKLGLPKSRVVVTVAEHANTSAASVPLALDTAVRDGRIQRGQLLMMEAMGAGLTWGAGLVRF